MQMQRQEEAYKSLEEYNDRYSSPYVLSTLAEHQLNMYNDSTALAYYAEALDIAPDYAPALLGKAETLRMTRKYGEYFSALNDYVSNESDMAKSKTDYLSAVIQRSDPKFLRAFMPQMDVIVEKTLQVHPSDSSALNLAGLYYYATERPDKAKSKFRENARTYSSSLSATASYVEFLMYVSEWRELTEEALAAYEKFPAEPAFLEMASMGSYNLNELEKVLEISDRILAVAPSDSAKTLRAWSTKGDVYSQLGNPKKSYKAYENALKINPDYSYVLNNYAYYLSVSGKNLKKALVMSRKTIEAEPDNATYLDTYGWILYLLGKAEEAKPHFKHAMLYGGKDSAVILDHYAEVLFELGEYDRAMVYWNQALRKDDGKIADLKERIELRKQQMKKKTEHK
jgi:tetratricopeptide (TPR) repeat protein